MKHKSIVVVSAIRSKLMGISPDLRDEESEQRPMTDKRFFFSLFALLTPHQEVFSVHMRHVNRI
jgi:hypothetical protein